MYKKVKQNIFLSDIIIMQFPRYHKKENKKIFKSSNGG